MSSRWEEVRLRRIKSHVADRSPEQNQIDNGMSSILIKPVLHVVYRAGSETFIGVIVYSLSKHYATPHYDKPKSIQTVSLVAKRNLNETEIRIASQIKNASSSKFRDK